MNRLSSDIVNNIADFLDLQNIAAFSKVDNIVNIKSRYKYSKTSVRDFTKYIASLGCYAYQIVATYVATVPVEAFPRFFSEFYDVLESSHQLPVFQDFVEKFGSDVDFQEYRASAQASIQSNSDFARYFFDATIPFQMACFDLFPTFKASSLIKEYTTLPHEEINEEKITTFVNGVASGYYENMSHLERQSIYVIYFIGTLRVVNEDLDRLYRFFTNDSLSFILNQIDFNYVAPVFAAISRLRDLIAVHVAANNDDDTIRYLLEINDAVNHIHILIAIRQLQRLHYHLQQVHEQVQNMGDEENSQDTIQQLNLRANQLQTQIQQLQNLIQRMQEEENQDHEEAMEGFEDE
jgi:hypothetical protein